MGTPYAFSRGDLPGGEWALWLSGDSWTVVVSQGLLIVLLLLLPTGRLASPAWRKVAWVAVAWLLVTALATAFAAGPLDDILGLRISNPAGLPEPLGWLLAALAPPFRLSAVLLLAVSVASLVSRFRRAQSIERQQLKWLAMAALIFTLVVGATLVGMATIGNEPSSGNEAFIPFLIAGTLSPVLLPAAVGAAIFRYRLFEIDRIISRTVSYLSVVALSGSVFFVSVTALTLVLPSENELAVATSTLGAAALFSPIRRGVKMRVDRRFNRTRYDAERVYQDFVDGLRERVDLDVVVAGWLGVVQETLQPSSAAAWIRPTGAAQLVQAHLNG